MTPTPASNLSDDEIEAIRRVQYGKYLNVRETEHKFARAIEAKVLDRARATAEPVAYLVTWPDGDQDLRWEKPESDYSSHYPDGPARIDALSLGATVAPSPAPDSQESLLRAMARNYGDGPHQWDKLDRIACERAAEEIKSLRAASGASPEPTAEAWFADLMNLHAACFRNEGETGDEALLRVRGLLKERREALSNRAT